MSSYFISLYNPPNWSDESGYKVHLDNFAQELAELWLNVQIKRMSESSNYILWWEVMENDLIPLMGGLQNSLQVVSLEGSSDYVARYTHWYRQFIPDEHHLYFFHESMSLVTEIISTMSVEQIQKIVNKS